MAVPKKKKSKLRKSNKLSGHQFTLKHLTKCSVCGSKITLETECKNCKQNS